MTIKHYNSGYNILVIYIYAATYTLRISRYSSLTNNSECKKVYTKSLNERKTILGKI